MSLTAGDPATLKQTLKEGGYADIWISYLLDQRPQMEIILPLLIHCPRINAAPNQMEKEKEKELGTTQLTTSSGQLLFDHSKKKKRNNHNLNTFLFYMMFTNELSYSLLSVILEK